MPVTARLSKAFYDQFGEQVTNELVEWFNQVDLTYRTDLRTLNDTNFARFEAVLGVRFAQADLRVEQRFAELNTRIEQRFAEFDTRIEQRFAKVDARFAQFEVKFAQAEARQERDFAALRQTLQDGLIQQFRWMIALWMTTMVGIMAVLLTLLRQGG